MSGDRSRKRPKGAPRHVRTFCVRLTPKQRVMVNARFHAGARVYNACLAEAMRRAQQFRADPAFAVAKQMPEGKTRSEAFAALRAGHGFTTWSMQSFGSGLRKAWVREQVLSQETQLLAASAFGAVNRWHVGQGGRPRFKSTRITSRGLRSLGCKDVNGALQPVLIDGILAGLRWGKGNLLAVAPVTSKGRKGREQRAELAAIAGIAAAGDVLSCRIVKTMVRGNATYRAHLVCEGHPPLRHPVGRGTVSVDLGPSNIAVVTAQDGRIIGAKIHPLAPSLVDTEAELRRLQRRHDRQHRAGSPGCFDYRGRHTEKCQWRDRSKGSRRTQARITETYRVRAAYRATAHGALVNHLLSRGAYFHAEKLNYIAWQKNFPRSVRDRAPGMLVELIRRKAESAGGGLYEYSPYSTALSQTCVCGARKKKTLDQRRHLCACGACAHRDLFSAFLGLFVHRVTTPDGRTVTDTLDVSQANTTWLTAHDTQWQPASRKKHHKQRGQVRPTGRSVARIKARRLPLLKSEPDRAARLEPVQTEPTAPAVVV